MILYSQLTHWLSACRSPAPAPAPSLPTRDEDYWRQLRGTSQDEDWSTVDNKKDRKGKAAPKPADGAAAPATTNSWDAPDDDGWEDAGALLDPRPAPPGVHSKPDASASVSEQNGHEPVTSTGRSDSDLQCDKCGKWGHVSSNCSEEFCDRCLQPGHSIRKCKQPKSSKGFSEQEKSREARLTDDQQRSMGIQCHRCKEYGHRMRDCHLPAPVAMVCYNCQQVGHAIRSCPHPHRPGNKTVALVKTVPISASRRHADFKGPQLADPSQHQAEQDEQQQGRGKGWRSRDGQAEGSEVKTLTISRDNR